MYSNSYSSLPNSNIGMLFEHMDITYYITMGGFLIVLNYLFLLWPPWTKPSSLSRSLRRQTNISKSNHSDSGIPPTTNRPQKKKDILSAKRGLGIGKTMSNITVLSGDTPSNQLHIHTQESYLMRPSCEIRASTITLKIALTS